MRWVVEVTALGKSEKESLFLESDSWQKALQGARAQRGDTAPMSGFSIELLDDGCRAVDPVSRVRYEVRKAPEEAAANRSQPPRPASQAAAPAATAPATSHAPSAPRAAVVPSTRSQPAASPARTASTASGVAMHAPAAAAQPPPAVIAPQPAPAAAPVPVPAPQRTDVAAGVPSQIIFKREQDPTDAMPLAYREYVYSVPPGTTEAMAETLLATQFELVRSSLERLPPGKLVNLAVFDLVFQGKPPVPPLATVAWKDWRGAPVVAFPRRAPAPQPFVPQPPPTAPVLQQAAAPVAAPVQPAPAPVFPAAGQPFPAPAQAFAPPVVAPTFQPSPVPATAPQQPLRPSGSIRPASQPGVRARAEDLIADLFEAMHDLHFVRDAIEGGEFCLALAMEKLPSRAGIVHLYDIDKREFLVTSTRGPGTGKILLKRHAENDAILQAAMNRRRAIVIADTTHSTAVQVERYEAVGGVRSLIVAPVMQHGRFLGALELWNPIDGQPFTDAEGNALNYIAEQFAEFLASHGIVTDPERISARQLPDA
jgi:putative methionine-R-sulfoxide reductase with GAF domain